MSIKFDNTGFRGGFNVNEVYEQYQNSRTPKTAKSPLKAVILALPLELIFLFCYFYIEIPAINIHAQSFWTMVFIALVVFLFLYRAFGGFRTGENESLTGLIRKRALIPIILILASLLFCLIGSAAGWVIFRSGAYSELLQTDTGDFAAEVEEVRWDRIPMLDSASANTLANRKLGELSELVSQFEVDTNSAQINYCDKPVRVSYLNYGDIIKWWNNKGTGIPAYIVTDMQTQAVSVVRLDQGIRYSPSELFNRDINRHLRFEYPTLMFGDVNFEIDEEGTPWWVASVECKKIGLFGGVDVQGAVLCNAVTGECTYYDVANVPLWVDRVYDAELIMQQYNYYGLYHNGYLNSMFGQSDCRVTTSGYNYIAMDDDVWLYTGITSVGGDESNIGFILVNQRTKKASYYSCAGAEEYSGMASAQGAVQQYSYVATFPLLLNIQGKPTYFMALKDANQLVKMYAMVNVQEYQIVAIGSDVKGCLNNYISLLTENGIISESTEPVVEEVDEYQTISGEITDIRTAVVSGNSVYYIALDGNTDCYYMVQVSDIPEIVIADIGDSVTFRYTETESSELYKVIGK